MVDSRCQLAILNDMPVLREKDILKEEDADTRCKCIDPAVQRMFGQAIDREVSGFHARVVQHETDHLWGILYPRRIRDLRNFGFSDVLFPESPA